MTEWEKSGDHWFMTGMKENTFDRLCADQSRKGVKMRKKDIKRAVVLLLTLLLALTQLPGAVAKAEDNYSKTDKNTSLGSSGISSPSSKNGAWKGNYVFYGKYPDADGKAQPVRYRVLAPDTTDFSEADKDGN